jgi:hypothetical protein
MPDAKAKSTKPLCFVVGPIGSAGSDIRKHADMILHAVLKEVLEKDELGYKLKRADEDPRPGMIGDRVIHDILNAELVVADLTDLNPNAFYELGIRHLSERPTIHIAKEGTVLPFDNLGHDTIFVDVSSWQSILGARKRVLEAAKSIQEADFRVSNPITQAKASIALAGSADPKDKIIADMRDRIADIERKFQPVRKKAAIAQPVNVFGDVSQEIAQQVSYELSMNKLQIESLPEFIANSARERNAMFHIIGLQDDRFAFMIGDYLIRMKLDGSGWATTQI